VIGSVSLVLQMLIFGTVYKIPFSPISLLLSCFPMLLLLFIIAYFLNEILFN